MAKAKTEDEAIPGPGSGVVEFIPASPTPMALIERALTSGASMEMIEKLMTLQERYEANQARKAFDTAMAAAAAEMPVISKSTTVDFTSQRGRTTYKHADLAEIVSTVGPILGKHGLHHRFETNAEIGQPVVVTCIIAHKDGHSIRTSLPGPRDDSGNKNSIQAMGSTITYLSRYTLMAILGLAASKDDDGQAAEEAKRSPVAAPDVMPRPTAPSAKPPSTSPPKSETASNSEPPKKLSITQIAQLEEDARIAADKGSAEFRTFWLNHNGAQERAVITGIGSELAKRRDEADAQIVKDLEGDNEAQEAAEYAATGEINE